MTEQLMEYLRAVGAQLPQANPDYDPAMDPADEWKRPIVESALRIRCAPPPPPAQPRRPVHETNATVAGLPLAFVSWKAYAPTKTTGE